MYNQYDDIRYVADNLNSMIRELHCRRRFHDIQDFANIVVDQIFNQGYDLCKIPSNLFDFNMFHQLLGFESDVFKQICQDGRLFEHLILSIIEHSRRNRLSINILRESAFIEIFQEVLNRFLPLNEDNLSYLKACDWFTTINKKTAKSSALRLLRPEIIAASYHPEVVLHSGGGIRTMYPKIYDFTKLMFNGLANCSYIPYPTQVYLLNRLIIHYTSFLFKPLSDPDFEKFKQMMRDSALLEKDVKPFLSRWLQNFAFDEVYIELLEIWLYLIYPSDNSICSNHDRMLMFFKLYSKSFIDILVIIENRCRVADLTLMSHVKFILTIIDGVYDSTFCSMFRKLKINPDEFLEEMREKVQQYLYILQEQKKEKESKKHSWLTSMFTLFQDYVAGETEIEKELQFISNILDKKLEGKVLKEIDFSKSSINTSTSSFAPMANSTPKKYNPDYSIDPKTKLLYLTPRGREQVLQRKAMFDFSKCFNKSSRSLAPKSYEISFLVTFAAYLSNKYSNSNFVKWMKFHRHESKLAAMSSKLFLLPSSPRYVPVYSKTVIPKTSQLNLRFIASYPFVFVFLIILLLIFNFIISIFY